MTETSKTALVIVFDGVEELEAIASIDILRRAEIEVTVASRKAAQKVTGRNDISIVPDTSLDQIDPTSFDLILLPGGPGVLPLAEDDELKRIVRTHAQNQRLTAAICAAPKVLAEAGVLERVQATSHSSVRSDLPNPSDDPVVAEGQIVTSQGAGTAVEFALKVAELMTSAEKAREVREAIHA